VGSRTAQGSTALESDRHQRCEARPAAVSSDPTRSEQLPTSRDSAELISAPLSIDAPGPGVSQRRSAGSGPAPATSASSVPPRAAPPQPAAVRPRPHRRAAARRPYRPQPLPSARPQRRPRRPAHRWSDRSRGSGAVLTGSRHCPCLSATGRILPHAPVAQWIEHRFPKPCAQVRFLPGARRAAGTRRSVTVLRMRSRHRLGDTALRDASLTSRPRP